MKWQAIETAPTDGTPVILANFSAMCLMSGAPHVWSARFARGDSWIDGSGNPAPIQEDQWLECSHAAMNENGEPTHWSPMPESPETSGDKPE